MTLVELMVAVSILALVMTGLALSIGVDYKAVALSRSRQVAEAAANRRLEELRDVDYASMALATPAPIHKIDPTNPDYFVTGGNYDVTGTGQNEVLIVASGGIAHIETPVTIGTTVLDIYQYVTWVDDPAIAGTQNLKRLSVVVQYHSIPTVGGARMLRESVILTNGTVSLGASAMTSPPPVASFTSAAAASPPFAMAFTDTTTGTPTSWAWDFNADAVTDSTAQNPSHTFPSSGSYPVTLTATNGSGTSSTTTTTTVSATTTPTTTPTTCGSFSVAGSSGASSGYSASTTVTIAMALSGCSGTVIANFSNDGGTTWGADVSYSSSATTVAWTLPPVNGTKTISGRARNGAAGTPWSLASNSIILDTTAPTAPASISRTASCSGSNRTVVLTWTASTDTHLVGYHVYRSTDGVTWVLVISTAGLTASDTHSKSLTSVRFYVKGYDSAGNESSASPTISLSKNQCS